MIEVDLDRFASQSEVEAVQRALEEVHVEATVRASYETRSVEIPPWVIYIFAGTVATFWGGLVAAAGADAWKGLRDLIAKLFRARETSKAQKGSVVVVIEDVHEWVVFADHLPDEAFKSILRIEIRHTPAGQLQWDEKSMTWRDPLQNDRAK